MAILFTVGNSGVAAALSVCSMETEVMACCRAFDDGCADIDLSEAERLQSPDNACMTTTIIGGVSVDDGVIHIENEVRPMPFHGVDGLQSTETTAIQYVRMMYVPDTSPPAVSPPLYLLTSAFLI